ncbi:hypothetical protein ACTHOQ_06460 [Solibacillus silvestris]|uniref:hypothetical protein n=1 Tax=Solibacillus silvestris TaxID=76853 RepID=UPI003F7D2E63
MESFFTSMKYGDLMKKMMTMLLTVLLIVGCTQKELMLDDELIFELQNVNEKELELLKEHATNFTIEELKQNYATIIFDYQIQNGEKFDNLTVQHNDDFSYLMDQVKLQHGPFFILKKCLVTKPGTALNTIL